jgi:hypothetical protein
MVSLTSGMRDSYENSVRIAKHRLAGDPLLQEILIRAPANAGRQLVVPSRSPVQIGSRARGTILTDELLTPTGAQLFSYFVVPLARGMGDWDGILRIESVCDQHKSISQSVI